MISQWVGLRLEAVRREAVPDEGVRGGQVRTAGGHKRNEGPRQMRGGWRAETLGVSSRLACLPDPVWVWAPTAGQRGEWSVCGKGCWD